MKRTRLPDDAPTYSVDPDTGHILIKPRVALYEKGPITTHPANAVTCLHEELAAATELYLHHGDGGRLGVKKAIFSLIEFMESQGVPHATMLPVASVLASIVDAQNGIENPIFKPDRSGKSGKPPKPVMQREFEGKLAIVMECCVRHCRNAGKRPYIEPASRLAAKLINESHWPVRVTARQLIELRERVQQTRPGTSPERIEVDISMASEGAKENPLEWAKILLKHEWVNPLPKNSG